MASTGGVADTWTVNYICFDWNKIKVKDSEKFDDTNKVYKTPTYTPLTERCHGQTVKTT